jgi:hypothetical protein
MRRLVLSLALLLAASSSAFAFDTPRALLEALYSPYSKGDSFDWSSWDEAQFRSAELNKLFEADAREAKGEIGRLDFDPYIDGQDYKLAVFTTGEPAIDGDLAKVEVTFKNFELAEDLMFTLVKEAGGWKVDDVVSSDKNFPYSLKAIMQAPLDP